jgi:hypothetical protein
VWPVRVRAGAFGPDKAGVAQPKRDLLLSPDHAVFVEGVLIPVRYLLNGRTVVQERRRTITYWHVELASHDILYANGLAAESYLDTGNRHAFENGGPAVQLHADFARAAWDERACAALVLEGPALEAGRRHVLAQAEALGHALTREPDLRIVARGAELRPEAFGGWLVATLPAETRSIRLLSRSAIPAETGANSGDHRRLGVAVARLTLDGTPIPLDSTALGAGWHEVEMGADGPAWRWTDGDAKIATGGGFLVIELAMTETYWAASPAKAARAA